MRLGNAIRQHVPPWFIQRRRPVRVDLREQDVWLFPTPFGGIHVGRQRAVIKEPWTVRWLLGSLSRNGVYWDVGANVGPYALIAAKVFGPAIKVVAVEPGAPSFDGLVRNIVGNRTDDTVIPVCVALSDRDRVDGLSYRSLTVGEGLTALGNRAIRDATGPSDPACVIPTLVLTIDTLVSSGALPAPTHLKVDVEGGELRVLAGASRTLRSHPPHSVMVELDSEEAVGEVESELQPAGLRLATWFAKSPTSQAVDAFFARDPESLRTLLADLPERRSRR